MSRGPGQVEQAIASEFDQSPHAALSVADLCAKVYPGANRIEPKHRFSVSRAMRAFAERRRNVALLKARTIGNPLLMFNRRSLQSVTDAARKERGGWLHLPDFAEDGPWARAVELAAADLDGDDLAAAKAVERMRSVSGAAFLIGFRLFDALIEPEKQGKYFKSTPAP